VPVGPSSWLYLASGEELIVFRKPYSCFRRPMIRVFVGLVVLWAVMLLVVPGPVTWLVGLFMLVVGLVTLSCVVAWYTTDFVITTDRIIERSGILSTHTTTTPLDRVTSVHVSQNALQRPFGCGDVVIEPSAWERGFRLTFHSVDGPTEVMQEIYRQRAGRSR
jgi:uncharacterized membrane protein YdbT with pleckstrin-like domain